MKKKILILAGGGLVLILAVVALVMGLVVGPNMEREALLAKFPDRGVPRINIELNGVSLDEIKAGSKEEKYEGNKVTIFGEGELLDDSEEYKRALKDEQKNKRVVGRRNDVWKYNDVQIKGRGNGTWSQEKKPYQIKFKDKVDLFGMGEARKWVLLSNAMDSTSLRNDITFYLERILGMKYIFDGEYVELYMDGEYEGLYYLTHAVEVGKNSVDLKDSMGVLVELDNIYGALEEHWKSNNGDLLVVKDVVRKDDVGLTMKDFMDSYNKFESAVAEKNYKRISELVDVESFAKYYLLSEFTVNPDAYWTSFFMYKDGGDDKIHAGPGWDFDLVFANRSWGNWMGEEFYSPTKAMVRKSEIMPREAYEELGLTDVSGIDWHEWSLNLSHIVFDLMTIPEFKKEVEQIYMDRMEPTKEEFLWRIEQRAGEIEELVRVDSEKWDNGNYWDEVNAMKEWISERYQSFDEWYGNN